MTEDARRFAQAVNSPFGAEAVAGPLSHLRYLADAMPQLVWTADGEGVVDYYNSRAREYAGIESMPHGAWEWSPVVHPDDLALTLDCWTTAVRTGTLYQCEHRVRMADGTFRWHLSRGVPVRDDGRVVKWFGTATDVHSIKLAEESLREVARRKDEFIALLSHELRNPLAPVRNALELMRAMPLDAPLQRLHGILDRQVGQMVRLVDDLLEISRISRGDFRLDVAPMALSAALSNAVEMVEPALQAGGQHLELSPSVQGVILDGDVVRLSQAFGNLLSNAIKFTARGDCIGISARVSEGTVDVTVTDSGVGIESVMLERVFDMFTQVRPAGANADSGLGIGLALVRRIVEMHGGSVSASSGGLGSGSSFVVTLPRQQRRVGG